MDLGMAERQVLAVDVSVSGHWDSKYERQQCIFRTLLNQSPMP
jgi:hypothetical protein